MRPMNGKTKNDVYARTFEILDLKKEMVEMKADYKKKKERYDKLVKQEKDYQERLKVSNLRKKV